MKSQRRLLTVLGATIVALGITTFASAPTLGYDSENSNAKLFDFKPSRNDVNNFKTPLTTKFAIQPTDQSASLEMQSYAMHYYGFVEECPGTFSGTENWSPLYTLRWVDVTVTPSHETVRVYHATHKHHPYKRFVTIWDSAQSRWTDWKEVQ